MNFRSVERRGTEQFLSHRTPLGRASVTATDLISFPVTRVRRAAAPAPHSACHGGTRATARLSFLIFVLCLVVPARYSLGHSIFPFRFPKTQTCENGPRAQARLCDTLTRGEERFWSPAPVRPLRGLAARRGRPPPRHAAAVLAGRLRPPSRPGGFHGVYRILKRPRAPGVCCYTAGGGGGGFCSCSTFPVARKGPSQSPSARRPTKGSQVHDCVR